MRLTALERTKDLPSPRLAELLFKTWVGSAGVNPAFLAAQVLLIAAWRVAGQLGADHWLLDRLGTVRQPGRWFTRYRTPTTTPTPA